MAKKTTDNTAIINPEASMSERFTSSVLREFRGGVSGELQITDYQRQLIQGYFIGIDRALKTAEEQRERKNASNRDHKYDNPLPVTWANVNLPALALDVMHYARMGLDMMQDNHLWPIPFRNNKTNQYDMTLMPGYNGIQYIAEKYAIEQPVAVTIELVYSGDTFVPIKRSRDNKVESYEFSINSAFDRGTVVGGFGYIEYREPQRNKLIIMTMRDIEKRKPRYASAEFWGGTKSEWRDGKKTEVETDGWFEEMCLKTIKREVYSAKHLPRDPRKVDEAYQHMRLREAQLAEERANLTASDNANVITIDTSEINVMDTSDDEPDDDNDDAPAAPPPSEPKPSPKTKPTQEDGPTF